ncbi:MAG: cytochrome c [Verrucomicrobia bacterium]|nr:cytochrome c [Verrucomicrobiota bacterium]
MLAGLLGSITPARAEDGATLFAENCAACHGLDGHGQTPQGRKIHAKDLTRSQLTRGEIARQIREGSKVKTGKSVMQPFADKLSAAQIDLLVAHVLRLRK